MQQTGPARKATIMSETYEIRENTPAEIAAYNRQDQINALHQMADWLQHNPDVPITYGVQLSFYCSLADARAIRAASVGDWQKVQGEYSSYTEYVQTFTPPSIASHKAVSYSLLVSKQETCTRVQTGTRHVEATEAYDEPVYEWKCEP